MRPAIAIVLCLLVAGCGEEPQEPIENPRSNPLVGRWEMVRTCEDTLTALEYFKLEKIAPIVLADFFPSRGADQVPRRRGRMCRGAKPIPVSHYFTPEGQFGSVDQDDAQTDRARYTLLDDQRFRLDHDVGQEIYEFRIQGNVLTLDPDISPGLIRDALEQPLDRNAAAHMIAVAMPGQTWQRTSCGRWC